MINISKHKELFGKKINALCTDGETIIGSWVDWLSEIDNEPDPESIIIKNKDGVCIEIFVKDIKRITAVSE